jgi:polyphosphate glucokinase
MSYFGIDIGCTAIKFGEVNLDNEIQTNGFDMRLISQTKRTEKYTETLTELIQLGKNSSGIGLGFPSVVWENGIMDLEIKFNKIWKKVDQILLEENIPHFALNDADAAGFAEVYNPQAAELRKGVTLVLTLGTGIGSGLFLDGKLVPNTELGMLEVGGMMAEELAAASIKWRDSLSMEDWASRLQKVITQIEILLSPDHILLGGGISSDFEEFRKFLSTKHASLEAAHFRNQAGVVGAAMYAAYRSGEFTLK